MLGMFFGTQCSSSYSSSRNSSILTLGSCQGCAQIDVRIRAVIKNQTTSIVQQKMSRNDAVNLHAKLLPLYHQWTSSRLICSKDAWMAWNWYIGRRRASGSSTTRRSWVDCQLVARTPVRARRRLSCCPSLTTRRRTRLRSTPDSRRRRRRWEVDFGPATFCWVRTTCPSRATDACRALPPNTLSPLTYTGYLEA